jgi:hypothetical protein
MFIARENRRPDRRIACSLDKKRSRQLCGRCDVTAFYYTLGFYNCSSGMQPRQTRTSTTESRLVTSHTQLNILLESEL